jgi:integrase
MTIPTPEEVGLALLRRTLSIRHQLLVTLFSEHVRRTGDPGGWMFSRDGVPLNRNSAGHQWRQVRKDAGLDGYTLHDLRHFYASGLIASGCDVVTVQRALGRSGTRWQRSPAASTPTCGLPLRTARAPQRAA